MHLLRGLASTICHLISRHGCHAILVRAPAFSLPRLVVRILIFKIFNIVMNRQSHMPVPCSHPLNTFITAAARWRLPEPSTILLRSHNSAIPETVSSGTMGQSPPHACITKNPFHAQGFQLLRAEHTSQDVEIPVFGGRRTRPMQCWVCAKTRQLVFWHCARRKFKMRAGPS